MVEEFSSTRAKIAQLAQITIHKGNWWGKCACFICSGSATAASVTPTPRSPAIIGWWLTRNPTAMVAWSTTMPFMAWLTTPSNSIAWWAPWYGSLLLCWRFWLLISFFWLGSWRFCLSAGGLGFSGCLISRLLMVSPPLLLSCIPIFSALDDNILIITAFSFSKKVQSCISLVHRIQRQSQNDQLIFKDPNSSCTLSSERSFVSSITATIGSNLSGRLVKSFSTILLSLIFSPYDFI
ncbi:unnamed protein product, partial [Vitis vinifera]